jgi:hypothetical protein
LALTPEQEHLWIAELEKMGETQARSNLEGGKISAQYVHLTSTWLSGREREAKHREEALQSEKMELMRRDSAAAERQAQAAERANKRATLAILIAVVSLIVAVISLFKR